MPNMGRDLSGVHIGYLVDTQNEGVFVAGERDTTSWIQAFPIGKWTHPEYGDIEMNVERAARMAAGVNAGIRGQELPINYDHEKHNGYAAGWVQRAEARPDGLWLNVEWTREAYSKLKNKEYKYFSPEYMNLWKHPANGQKYTDVLVGGALTNMPHLKGILPLNLSEVIGNLTEEDLDALPESTKKEILKEMTRKSINDLPDSAFAFIEGGGKKDSDGKTIPRSLRHFPIHDEAHVRNALARASQSPFGDKALPKIKAAAKRMGIKVSSESDTRSILEMIATAHGINFTEKITDKELFDQVAEAVRRKRKPKKSWTYGEQPGSVIAELSEEAWDLSMIPETQER